MSMPGSCPMPCQGAAQRLGRDALGRQRDRVERAGDQVGAGARRLQRERDAAARGALAVEADRQVAELAQLADELAGVVRLEQRPPGR